MTTTPAPGSLEALIAALTENTAVTRESNEIAARLLAGQQAALDKLEGAKAPSTRTKKTTETPTTPAEEPKTTETPAAAAEQQQQQQQQQQPAARVVTDADITAEARGWMGEYTAQPDQQKVGSFLREVMNHFGYPADAKITGPTSPLTDEQRKQALFFIQRARATANKGTDWAANSIVNFGAEYDFDGDPTQAVEVSDDPLG